MIDDETYHEDIYQLEREIEELKAQIEDLESDNMWLQQRLNNIFQIAEEAVRVEQAEKDAKK